MINAPHPPIRETELESHHALDLAASLVEPVIIREDGQIQNAGTSTEKVTLSPQQTNGMGEKKRKLVKIKRFRRNLLTCNIVLE